MMFFGEAVMQQVFDGCSLKLIRMLHTIYLKVHVSRLSCNVQSARVKLVQVETNGSEKAERTRRDQIHNVTVLIHT